MSKITKDNLSDKLKDELVTDAEMLDVTGNKENLTTTDKANLVAAINELKIDFDTLRVQYEELKKVVNEGSTVVECVSIELDVENLEFTEIGKSQEITATILPSDCTEQLVWHSSNEAVATVTDGVVITTGIGNCTISAICGSKIDTCNVQVEEPDTSIYLLKEGQFIDNTEFGESLFDSANTAFIVNENKKVIGFNMDEIECGIFTYGTYIDANMFTEGSTISVTLFREITDTSYSGTINLIVALFNDYISGSYGSISTAGYSTFNFREINSGVGAVKTVYEFDVSSFAQYTGYLGFAVSGGQTGAGAAYISDIEYVPGDL